MKTAAERRKRYNKRVGITWGIAVTLIALALSSLAVRQFLGAAAPIMLNVIMLIAFQAIQMFAYFGLLMYFLSGTRTDKIMPGDARALSLEDYRGQPIIHGRAEQMARILEGYSSILAMGGEAPRGLLLIGGPGTGKTYLAQCLAGQVGVPFLLLDASGLVSMWMGMGSIKVMRFFGTLHKLARRYGAVVAFLDEIDAIGAARGGVEGQAGMLGGMRGMWGGGMGVLNTLLSRMDGLDQPPGLFGMIRRKFYGWLGMPLPKLNYHVLVIAATNRPSVLDAALTRAGRFDWQWRVDTPTEEGLRSVVEYYLAKVAHEPEVNVARIASVLRGATPADVRTAIMRNAVILAEAEGRELISEHDIYRGSWEARIGLEMPPPEPYEPDQVAIAWHEAGHMIMLAALFPELRGLMATIVPHAGTGAIGATLGMVVPGFKQERQSLPLDFLLRRLMLSMAGREATALQGEGRTHMGFGGDRANMQVALWGLIAEGALGYNASLLSGGEPGKPFAGLGRRDRKRLETLLLRASIMTRRVLFANRDQLAALATLLRAQGTVTADQLERFFDEWPVADLSVGVIGELLEALEESEDDERDTNEDLEEGA